MPSLVTAWQQIAIDLSSSSNPSARATAFVASCINPAIFHHVITTALPRDMA
jgi:hypothetical protein